MTIVEQPMFATVASPMRVPPASGGSVRHRLRRIFAAALAAVVVLTAADWASANRRSRGHGYYVSAATRARQQAMTQAANSQLAAAKQVLSAAEAKGNGAQSKLDAAVSKLREASHDFYEAQSTARQLAKELAGIEQEILDDQKADTPYGKAATELQSARRSLNEVEAKILEGSDAKKALAGLSGVALTEKKTALLELHGDYLLAKSQLAAAATDVSRIRRELFQADSDWKETAEALTQARKDEKEAEEKAQVGSLGRIGLMKTIRSSSEAAAVARTAIAQAETALGKNHPNKKKSPSYSSSFADIFKSSKKK